MKVLIDSKHLIVSSYEGEVFSIEVEASPS